MTSLHSIITERFGVKTRQAENRETVAMTTTSALILRSDSGRLAALIINLGANEVFIRPNGVPSSTVGILVGPNGGSFSMVVEEDFNLVGLEFQGITPAGTSTLYILETVIEPDA